MTDPDERQIREDIDAAHDRFVLLLKDYCLKHPGTKFNMQVTMHRLDGDVGRVLFNEVVE